MEKFFKPIHLACSTDEMRPNMQCVKVEKGIATATDGNIMVRINLEMTSHDSVLSDLDKLEGKFINATVWKEMHKCDKVVFNDDCIDVFVGGVQKTLYYSTPIEEMWNEASIIEQVRLAGEWAHKMIRINEDHLAKLKKIFGTGSLTMSFSKGFQGIVVFPFMGSGMSAIVMPMTMDEVEERYMI